MFDRNTLCDKLYTIIEEEIPNFSPGKVEHITKRLTEAVGEWVPKHGDFWLDDEGVLRVNKGWEIVCVEAME